MTENPTIQAFIFDLDGVIVDTAKYHFLAWRRLANALGFDFDEKKNEELKGVSRMESLDRILGWGGISMIEEDKLKWAADKNEWYREHIKHMQDDEILTGVLPFLEACKQKGIKIALGSASKNARTILDQIGLRHKFDAIVDGTNITRSKPDPQVFQLGAEAMDVKPESTIVFEDAVSGVDAALAGGFYTIGIGSKENLGRAHHVIPNFIDHSPSSIIAAISQAVL